jgi:hypothetical protein
MIFKIYDKRTGGRTSLQWVIFKRKVWKKFQTMDQVTQGYLKEKHIKCNELPCTLHNFYNYIEVYLNFALKKYIGTTAKQLLLLKLIYHIFLIYFNKYYHSA